MICLMYIQYKCSFCAGHKIEIDIPDFLHTMDMQKLEVNNFELLKSTECQKCSYFES